MSRHNAQLRAAASAYENAEPDYSDDEVWAEAVQYVAHDDCAAVELLADPYTEAALYAAINGKSQTFPTEAALRALYEAAKSTQEAVQSRYDELIANGGRP